MLAISPELLARIAHLPRASTLDPETAFLFGNGNSAVRVQAPQDPVSLYKVINFICGPLALAFSLDDSKIGLAFLWTGAIVDEIEAGDAISTRTDIALDAVLLSGHVLVEGKDVLAGLYALGALFFV